MWSRSRGGPLRGARVASAICHKPAILYPCRIQADARLSSLRLPEDLSKVLREQAQTHKRNLGAKIRWIVREHQAREKAFDVGFGHITNEDNQP